MSNPQPQELNKEQDWEWLDMLLDALTTNSNVADINVKMFRAAVQVRFTAQAKQLCLELLQALTEEIEDIDQSRDIEEDAAGDIWCTSCEMWLESADQECGCNHLFQKRKQRLAKLQAKLAELRSACG